MARRRMLDPEFFDDKEFFLQIFSACSHIFLGKSRKFLFRIGRTVRLFYAGLWKYSDDSGRFLKDYVKIKAEIFPFDDDIAQTDIKMFMKVLKTANKVYEYEINGVVYGFVVKFLKHQKLNRPTPSKLPAPPQPKFTEWLKSRSRVTLESLTPEVEVEEKRKEVEGKGREGVNQNHFTPHLDENQKRTPPAKPKGGFEHLKKSLQAMDELKQKLKKHLGREPTVIEMSDEIWKAKQSET